MRNIVIVEAKRSAIGSFNGSLSGVKPQDISSQIIKHIITKHGIPNDRIDEVILGQVLCAGLGQNPARQASINAGLDVTVPARMVSMVCGSGLLAVLDAYNIIKAGGAEMILAGGQENMSLSIHASHMRNGYKMGDINLVDTMLKDGLTDAFHNYHMGITAENLATKYDISRLEQDEFALNSQMKAYKAQETGLFDNEILPIEIIEKKEKRIFSKDEFIKANATLESLQKLRPAFKADGTITAGNASGINDGAAILLVMSEEAAKKYDLPIIAKVESVALGGVDPAYMGLGPVISSKKALAKAGWDIKDLDLIEANEAFAAQAISVNRELLLPPEITNISGGAIALGHPIGASGARILVTLMHNMQRVKAKKAMATLCVGGGMGVTICLSLL